MPDNTYTATVTVADSGNGGLAAPESDVRSFNVVLRTDNAAPLLLPVGDLAATEGRQFSAQLVATDGDNNSLTYAADGLPETSMPALTAMPSMPPSPAAMAGISDLNHSFNKEFSGLYAQGLAYTASSISTMKNELPGLTFSPGLP